MNIENAKTRTVIDWFEKINAIPRPSKKEERISEWLFNWAGEHGLEAERDREGNVVVRVPASAGHQKAPTVVIQGHMDMVCEKTRESTHDFERDPIEVHLTDGWLHADGTTLGADNGVGVAMAMALAEETGLNGAGALEPGFVQGRVLVNLDSEDEGVFTVGCAGGRDIHLTLPIAAAAAPDGYAAYVVVAGGMRGGHSGVDIHEQRANALHVLARGLDAILAETDLRVGSLTGGTAHNAIPRDAEAVVYLPAGGDAAARRVLGELEAKLKDECAGTDPKAGIALTGAGQEGPGALSADESRKAVDLMLAFPHGVAEMSNDIPGLVETSNNFSQIRTGGTTLELSSSQRSSNMDKLRLLTDRIAALARLAGAEVEVSAGYPSWKPNMESSLLARCKTVYRDLFGKDPTIEIIHAGLECGIIGARYEGMDMISLGPTIKNPHSPEERIEVESIGRVWDFMAALLRSYK
jgi:dipeptidase D